MGELLSDGPERAQLQGNSDRVGESGLSKMSLEAKLSGGQNVQGVVGHAAQFGFGQGASPGKQGGQKLGEHDLHEKDTRVEKDHDSKNQIKRKILKKPSLTLGDFICNTNMKKPQNMPRNIGEKSETTNDP